MASSINSEDSQSIDTTGVDPTPLVEASDQIRALSGRREPVNILVIGAGGSGKSTLVNKLVGRKVAQTGGGGASVTSEVKGYRGEAMSIQLNVFDSVGLVREGLVEMLYLKLLKLAGSI